VRRRLLFLGILLTVLSPAPASADWLISPFLGLKFGGEGCPCPNDPLGALVDPEGAAGLRKFTFGGSFGLLTPGLLGVEIDFAHVPGYFNNEAADNTIEASSVMTLMGDVLIAMPEAISRDGLRPFLVGGLGWMRVSRKGLAQISIVDPKVNRLAMNIGGGAIGRISNRSSLRFELRQFRDLGTPDTDLALSYWRLTIGITLRY
jgi:hypothetical protein